MEGLACASDISDSGHHIDENTISFLALKAFIWKMQMVIKRKHVSFILETVKLRML